MEQLEKELSNRDVIWEEWYTLALAYYNHHGHLEVPQRFKTKNGYEYNETGVTLGIWISRLRQYQDRLTEERRNKLKQINFRFESNAKEIHWEKMYNLALAYYNYHGHSEMPQRYKTVNGYEYDESGVALGVWCEYIRQYPERLTEERIKKLELINFRFKCNCHDIKWEQMYQLAVLYYKHYGNSEMPYNFKTKNGIDYDENGFPLGAWRIEQRNKYRKNSLKEERVKKLEQINFNFEANIRELNWNKMYDLAMIYYKHYGHSEIPHNFKTRNGIDYDETGVALGNWCDTIRHNINKQNEDRIKKLQEINFRFTTDARDIKWEQMYQLAKIYYQQYGHSEIVNTFKTTNGIDYDENGFYLGYWCFEQRNRYQKKLLEEERIKKLEEINFRFESNFRDNAWNKMYDLALVYYKHYGHSEMPYYFKTKNGIDYDETGASLGSWAETIRQYPKRLTEERIKKLELINFRFTSNASDLKWERMYQLAAIYYKHYGHSEIPHNFKTTNGIDYSKDGIELGSWRFRQRQHQDKLTEERRMKLELIEFRFITKKDNEEQKKQLCMTYGIDYEQYEFLRKISYQELYAKIMFLLEYNYPLVTEGNLHEIFTMSNENMTLKYMINKEDMIMNYYIKRKGKNV